MAKIYNLNIDQGSTFISNVRYTDDDNQGIAIVGFSARGQMRRNYDSANAITFAANVTGEAAGNISVSLTAAETANIRAGRYVYDIEAYEPNTGVVFRVLEGIVTVHPEVTKI